MSSRTAAVAVSVAGSTIILTPVAAGAATVTVTAGDPGGLSATQSVSVTVRGGSPPAGDACEVGQELSPGEYCTVDIPDLNLGTNRFEVRSDGRGCFGSICFGNGLNLNGFRASRISGTDI